MPADIVSCPDCQRKLRVPHELIGKLVKCPTCGQTFTADPAAQAPAPTPPPLPPSDEKPVRTSKVSRDEDEEDDDEERSRRPRSGRTKDDDDEDRPRRRSRISRDDDDDDEDEDDGRRRRRRRRDLLPHRGGAVLTLGILSLVLGLPIGTVCGIIAWVMGNTDLAEIRAGRMDPEGEGMTNGGRICGIIGVILSGVGLVLIFGCCLMGLAGNAGGRH